MLYRLNQILPIIQHKLLHGLFPSYIRCGIIHGTHSTSVSIIANMHALCTVRKTFYIIEKAGIMHCRKFWVVGKTTDGEKLWITGMMNS